MIAEGHVVTPEELMAYRDGELPEQSAESVGAHLHGCPQCQELGGVLGDVSQILAGWKVAPVAADPDLERRLSERAAASSAKRPYFRTRVAALRGHRFGVVAGTAAFIALALVLGSISARRPKSTSVAQVSDRFGTRDRSASVGAATELRSEGLEEEKAVEALDATRTESGFPHEQVPEQQIASENQSITAPQSQQPMIAHTVSLSVVVKDSAACRTILDAILARHHGYAATLNASTQPNAARSLQASLRIPAGELRAAVAELKSLGRVESETQAGEEVTQQHADLVARLKNSRETEQRLEAILLQRTGKIGDVLAVEREIARVRGEIEQMEAEQKQLEHRVDFATIDLSLAEEYKAQIGSPSPSIATRFHNALVGGYQSAVESVVGILVFFAEYGPSAMIWVALFSPLAWYLRRRWTLAASVTL
jgi:anti-sigma factor RsiW